MYNILILDDEEIIRQGIKKRVINFDLNIGAIYEGDNGVEALEILKSNKIHLTLVDINMPFLNGLDFIRQGKEISKDTVFIIISGYDNFSYAQKAIEYGVFRYILKPINKIELKETIESGLMSLNSFEEEEEGNYKPLIKSILKELQENYRRCDYSLTDLAETVGFSDSYISKALKKETGLSFNEYLTTLRIDKAKEILVCEGRLTSVNEVAKRVGYSSQHYFSQVFKKYTGVAPSTYLG